jgi:hypothetical protein
MPVRRASLLADASLDRRDHDVMMLASGHKDSPAAEHDRAHHDPIFATCDMKREQLSRHTASILWQVPGRPN